MNSLIIQRSKSGNSYILTKKKEVYMNYAIISSNEKNIKGYTDIIIRALMKYDFYYKIEKFNDNNKNLDNYIKNQCDSKIYIIEQSKTINALDIVNKIRSVHEDLLSFIIIIDFEKKLCDSDANENFIFNIKVINDIETCSNKLQCIFEQFIKIQQSKKDNLNFSYLGYLYQIPYADILYFEKEVGSKLTKIVCKNGEYLMSSTIQNLEQTLGINFIKTHRSAIINAQNVKIIKLSENKVVFKNELEKILISRNCKKNLKKYFGDLVLLTE